MVSRKSLLPWAGPSMFFTFENAFDVADVAMFLRWRVVVVGGGGGGGGLGELEVATKCPITFHP